MANLQDPQLRIPLDFAEHLERQFLQLARSTGFGGFLENAGHLRALMEAQFGPIMKGPGH